MPPLIPHVFVDGVELKRCAVCGEYLPIADFHKQKGSADGLRFCCKECRKKETPEQKERRIAVKREYHERNRELERLKAREYTAANSEVISLRRAKHYWLNHEEEKQKGREKYHKHKEKYLPRAKEYKKNNPDVVIVGRHRRIHRIKDIPASLTVAEWQAIKDAFGHRCAYCGAEGKLEQEHVIPLSMNGEYSASNIIPVCRRCNSSKGSRSFLEWYPRQAFYNPEQEARICKLLGSPLLEGFSISPRRRLDHERT